MRKYKGFTLIEALILIVIASLMLLAMMPVLSTKKINTAVNSNVTQCITKEKADILTTSACMAAVNGGKSNSQNYLDSIIMYLEGDNPDYSAAALKVLGAMCDAGGSMACDKIIDRCAKDSTKCKIDDSNADLDYYLKLTAANTNAGRSYIENVLPSYYNYGLDNISNLVDLACCSTDELNSACTIKSKKMCPRKVGLDTAERYDYSYGSTVDSSGNIYLVGATTNTTDPDAPRDISIIKLNNSLEVQWQKKLGDSTYSEIGYGIAVDYLGNVYITGTRFAYDGTGDYDVPSGMIVAKLDSSGNFSWKNLYRDTATSKDGGNAIVLNQNSNSLYATGYTSDSGSDQAVLLLTINPSSGAVSSAYTYDPSTDDDIANDIKVDSSGYIYITGRGYSGRDILALKLDSSLNFTYGNRYNLASSDDMGFGLTIGNDNTIYVTGYSYTGTYGRDLFILALNKSNITKKWDKLYKPKSTTTEQMIGNRIEQDPYGNLIVAGYIEPRSHSTSCDNYEHIYAMKLSSKNGKAIWQKSLYPTDSRDSEIHGIFFPDKYSIMLTGGYLPINKGCKLTTPVFDATDTNYNYKMMVLKMDTVQTSDKLLDEDSLSLTETNISSVTRSSITITTSSIPDTSVTSLDMTYTVPSITFN